MVAKSGQATVPAGAAVRRNIIAWAQVNFGILVIIAVGPWVFSLVRDHVTFSPRFSITTAVSVAVAVASAVFLNIAARSVRNPRVVWVTAALALYSATVALIIAFQMVSPPVGLTTSSPLMADWAVIGLLAVATRPPRITDRQLSWILPGFALLITLIATGVVHLTDGGVAHLREFSTLIYLTLAGTMCFLAAALAVKSFLKPSGLLRPVSLGLLVIAAANLWANGGTRTSEPSLAYSEIRLFGLALLLGATMQLAQRQYREGRATPDEHQMALQMQSAHLKRMEYETAERHHELRNGLASLARAHQLLDKSLDPDEVAQLRRAVASELSRLEALLDGPSAAARPVDYLVAPILMDLVVLRRSAGQDVRLEVDERLRARGSPEVLAQIVTNLLANCERHAAGSPVRIRASREQHRVIVEVADRGPGISPWLRQVAVQRRMPGAHLDGSGLGLQICARLLDSQGGALRVLDPRLGGTGCTVRVELPSALDCSQS